MSQLITRDDIQKLLEQVTSQYMQERIYWFIDQILVEEVSV